MTWIRQSPPIGIDKADPIGLARRRGILQPPVNSISWRVASCGSLSLVCYL